ASVGDSVALALVFLVSHRAQDVMGLRPFVLVWTSWAAQILHLVWVMERFPNCGRGKVNLHPFSYPMQPMNLFPEAGLRIIFSFDPHWGHGKSKVSLAIL